MIELKKVSKSFGPSVKAIQNISFRVDSGEMAAIIGTSGCGKTTTLKIINRLVEPSKGRILIDKKDTSLQDPNQLRRKIGYVIQKGGLLPHLTVEQNISLLPKVLKKNKLETTAKVKKLMELVKLPYEDFARRFPSELSGGQQQRVGIARALIEDPPILLMDEPFGALDPITRAKLHEEFKDLNKNLKKTIVLVTHDIDEAFKLADKIILMDGGKIIQCGSKNELLNNPKNTFVTSFLKGQTNENT